MQTASDAGKSFLQNSLRLFITPRPIALVERRHIYQRLQQYGEILHYKSNFYDRTIYSPDTALLIFREKQAYNKLLAESPLTIDVERKTFDPLSLHWTYPNNGPDQSTALDLHAKPEELMDEEHRKPVHNSTPFLLFNLKPIETIEEKEAREQWQLAKFKEQQAQDETITFKITAEPFKGNQRSHLEHTPYWGPFRIRRSMIGHELRKRVPLRGLSDMDVFKKAPPLPIAWRQGRQLARHKTLRDVYNEAVVPKQSWSNEP